MRIIRDCFITAVLVLGVGTILIYGLGGEIPVLRWEDSTPTAKAAPAPSKPKQSVPTIAAPDLIEIFEQNELRGNHMFKGKTIIVRGEVEDIGEDILGSPYVSLGSGETFSFRSVQCLFQRSDAGKLVNLNKGQQIVLQGRVEGLMVAVIMKRCSIVQ